MQLRNPSKLVYSPHVYGPSVYGQPYFSVGNFPANMPAIWDTHFGFVPSTTGAVSPPPTLHTRTAHAGRTHRTRRPHAPHARVLTVASGAAGSAVVIGEWGGHYTGSNQMWLEAMGNYLLSKGMTDQFFWCLNPNSGDTGGLLQVLPHFALVSRRVVSLSVCGVACEQNDWTTPEQSKLTLLAKVVPAPTKFTTNANGQVCVSGGSTPAVSASASPKAGVSASPSPKAPAASASPSPKSSGGGGSNQFSFCCGSSVWWMAVTIPGSSSVRIDCGNGQGYALDVRVRCVRVRWSAKRVCVCGDRTQLAEHGGWLGAVRLDLRVWQWPAVLHHPQVPGQWRRHPDRAGHLLNSTFPSPFCPHVPVLLHFRCFQEERSLLFSFCLMWFELKQQWVRLFNFVE